MKDCLYIVVPCYNEQDVLKETAIKLHEKINTLIFEKKISNLSKVLFVDDGSKDKTWEIIKNLHNQNPVFSALNLSRNKGHQNALLAGLMFSKDNADMVISIDADLQDDINKIDEMVDKYLDGCEIVYGVRTKRKTDRFLKRFTAEGFYRLINFMGVETIFNHADYRLMSKRALEALSEFKEVNLFIRGLIPMLGFKSDIVLYERSKRSAGKSKYPFSNMINFALDGITSLSIKPIRMITCIGFFVFLISIAMFIYTLIRFFSEATVTGWPSLISSIWVIGGAMLLSIGVIGEYIGKIYLETKNRPKYFINEFLEKDKKNEE